MACPDSIAICEPVKQISHAVLVQADLDLELYVCGH